MNDGIDNVGEVVTGGMAARAVEPRAGEASGAEGLECLNCGTALAGGYCHNCGQAAEVHRTLTAWWHDISHSVLHLEGKIWRTLPLLAWKPGELTRRYINGERAKYVSPMALFLFSVFLMFAIFSIVGASAVGLPDSEVPAQELAAEIEAREEQVEALEAERDALAVSGAPTDAVEAQIEEAKSERDTMAATKKYFLGEDFETQVNTGWPRLDAGIKKAAANPSLLIYKVQANAYKFSWALIPLSVPFVWLLFFWKRRYRFYDHTVFVTYSIAFMSLAFIALVLLHQIGLPAGAIALSMIIIPPLHMYRQLRGAYGLRRFSALWRTFFLLIFANIAATLFLLLLLALGALA